MIEPRAPSKTDAMEEAVRTMVAEGIEAYCESSADVHASETSPVSAMAMAYDIARKSMLRRGANDDVAHRLGLLCASVIYGRSIGWPVP